MTGSGTQADPYIIYDVDDLQNIENDLTAYYELANDIDASATSGWNAGAGFLPLGQLGVDFTGSLNGLGHTISNLFINRPSEYIGLFIDNAGTIQRVGLVDCDITGTRIGAIVMRNRSGGSISQCYATGALKIPAGGGYANGLVYRNYATGTITNCYSRCSVTGQGTSWIAGFCFSNAGEIINCYSTGAVSGGTFEYGFDSGGGTVTNCFFDTETSGQADGGDAVGKTTAEMKTESTFTDAGWDFTTPIWYIGAAFNNGYPAFEGVSIPTVTANPASALSAIAATLNGTLNQDGGEACECGFEWGLDTGYGITTPTESKTTGESFSQAIGGLFPNTTYHFRAFATNSAGTGYSADRTFTTALVISRAFALAREEL